MIRRKINLMKYFQRLGRSLMLPAAVLAAAAIVMGIGYWIDGSYWGEGSIVSIFLINAGGSILDHLPVLFAVGIAFGMSKDKDGSAALAGLVGFLVITTMLSTDTIALLQGVDSENVNAAFGSIENAFIGIDRKSVV